ncbi:hypothetical protein CLOM_g24369 [Closterium sp. NIES-68]|nr:hypothetical protein CLOM_g24369 [Closterium sp. NIES-68]GJP68830.1 hypothetical protein CLOP_g25483 [Closterium sp. NIES-67]
MGATAAISVPFSPCTRANATTPTAAGAAGAGAGGGGGVSVSGYPPPSGRGPSLPSPHAAAAAAAAAGAGAAASPHGLPSGRPPIPSGASAEGNGPAPALAPTAAAAAAAAGGIGSASGAAGGGSGSPGAGALGSSPGSRSGRMRPVNSGLKKGASFSEGSFDNALAGRRVLIAEDTALLRKVAIIRMQKLGCTVEAVCDGQQAVDAVLASYASNSGRFDAVLMDCQMPVLDGYGATAAIRKAEEGTPVHTPIVALTAHAMTSDHRKCLDAGMDAYLTKPIDPALMSRTLLGLMAKYPVVNAAE